MAYNIIWHTTNRVSILIEKTPLELIEEGLNVRVSQRSQTDVS